jgi:phospholipase/carboxylesterase
MHTHLKGPELSSTSDTKKLVILLHGLGSDGKDLIELAQHLKPALPHAHFIAPNAPFRYDMSDSGYQWFSRGSINKMPDDLLNELEIVRPMLDEFVNKQLQRFNLKPQDLAVAGFSQGAMLAMHHFLRVSDPIGLIIGFSGLLPAPEKLATDIQSRSPVLITHGDQDVVIPPTFMHLTEKYLRANKVDVTAHISKGVGHYISGDALELAVLMLRDKLCVG